MTYDLRLMAVLPFDPVISVISIVYGKGKLGWLSEIAVCVSWQKRLLWGSLSLFAEAKLYREIFPFKLVVSVEPVFTEPNILYSL